MSGPPTGTQEDVDLDRLMARVRAAVAAGDAELPPDVIDVRATPENVDLEDLVTAQAEWNERVTAALAALTECVRDLQKGLTDLESRLPRTRPRREGRTPPRAGRPEGGRRK